MDVKAKLFELQDFKYREFHSSLIPTVSKDNIIGVRVPAIRKLAKEIAKDGSARKFISDLPHQYYDENMLHGILIGEIAKTPAEALALIDQFLPYVDNWAVCDSMPAKILKKDLALVRKTVVPWLKSNEIYRVRFAIVAMLTLLLDEEFKKTDLELIASIDSSEYYIKMAVAWYFSFALIKQYDAAIGLIESKRLEKWIQNKSIQKSVESYRITKERKDYLRSLKIK